MVDDPRPDLLSDPSARVNHDFQMLHKQQVELQKLREENKDVSVLLMKSKYAARSYADVSLCWCTVTNPIRQRVISIVMNPWFDRFILMVIIANCIFLALDDPGKDQTQEQWVAELVFLVLFTIEMMLKVLAMGFCLKPHSYLRDPWNILDFIVVCVGWIGIFDLGENISAIRTIRILRPLRTINSIPNMKVLVNSILNSIPMLVDIFIMFLFLLLVFGIVGTQSYAGLFRQKCFDGLTHEVVAPDDNALCWIDEWCDEGEINCGESGCDEDQYCWQWYANPNMGVTAFDNIFLSFLSVFTAITLEGWTDVMYMGREVSEIKYVNDLYFVLMIAIGAFFLINLIVAVQYDSFEDSVNEQKRLEQEEQAQEQKDEDAENHEPKEPNVEPTSFQYKWYNFRVKIYHLVQSSGFEWTIAILIIINTAFMASEHYPMSDTQEQILDLSNVILTAIFAVEMVLKLLGLGFRGYVANRFNIFDGALVIVGLIEILVLQGDKASGVIVLRTFRLFRIFKLAKSWRSLRKLLEVMIESLNSIAYLGLLCLLCMFIYALMGMQFFGKALKDDDGGSPRANFDNIGWSMTTIFQILTGENWNEVMYLTVNQTSWWASLYFVSLIVIGNYIIFNLFLAILLQKFSSDESENDSEEENEENEDNEMADVEGYEGDSRKSQYMAGGSQAKKSKQEASFAADSKAKKRRDKTREKLESKRKQNDPLPLIGKSFYIFGPENPIRMGLKQMILNPYFDGIIYGLIATSSVLLALDEPNISDYKRKVLSLGARIILFFFILEFLTKSIVMQFVKGKKSYLRNGWNRLDFFIVIIGIVSWTVDSSVSSGPNLSFLSALRALRALRPLRMVSRNEGLKTVVTSVMRSMPAVGNVILISLLFYLIFGILGVIFFKGAFYTCTDPNIENQDDCEGMYIDPNSGVIVERDWRNSDFHFDNVAMSMLTLFEVSTLEMWPDYMYLAIDSRGPGLAPKRDSRPAAAIFFMVFIFCTTFFIMNLFVGVVIEQFTKCQEELNGSRFLSPDQRQWVKTQKLLTKCSPQIKYIPPKERWRVPFYNLVRLDRFEQVIMTLIAINILFMCIYHYDMERTVENMLEIVDYIFVGIFVVEFLLKITGLGPKYYWADSWNRFDFIIVVVSVISIDSKFLFFNATVLRSLRIARLFRMIKVSKGLRKLFHTLLTSLPSLVNVGALLLLLFFVYGVAGMDLFGRIKDRDFITKHTNFRHFYDAIMTLFRASTGESWNGIMHDCMQQETDDDDSCKGVEECGAAYYAVPYWLSFMVIASFVFLNIFIAVILENFSDISKKEEQIELSAEDLRKYEDAWKEYAPYGQHFISTKYLFDLLNELDAPLGFKGQKLSKLHLLKIITAFDIVDHNGTVHFAEVLWVLAGTVSGTEMDKAVPCDAILAIAKNLPRKFPDLCKPSQDLTSLLNIDEKSTSAAEFLAATLIQKGWRKYLERKAMWADIDNRKFTARRNMNALAGAVVGPSNRDDDPPVE